MFQHDGGDDQVVKPERRDTKRPVKVRRAKARWF